MELRWQKLMGSRRIESHLPTQKRGRGIGTPVAETNGIALNQKAFAKQKEGRGQCNAEGDARQKVM